jgi:aminoglycoside phosphotransferase (APT) family kinase protein
LRAIIDWEIWSVGDPRTDLGWFLTYTDPVQSWAARRDRANQAAADAMPERDDLLAEYQAVRPVEIDDLQWFIAYGYYKIASTTAVLAKRNRRESSPDPGLEKAARSLGEVIDRGRETLAAMRGRRQR